MTKYRIEHNGDYGKLVEVKEVDLENGHFCDQHALKAVEIAREEIYEWLQENVSKYIEKQDTIFGTIKVINSHKLVNDLKQAMKDE
jgi:sRNA-binding carbon storage regulator CsrA